MYPLLCWLVDLASNKNAWGRRAILAQGPANSPPSPVYPPSNTHNNRAVPMNPAIHAMLCITQSKVGDTRPSFPAWLLLHRAWWISLHCALVPSVALSAFPSSVLQVLVIWLFPELS